MSDVVSTNAICLVEDLPLKFELFSRLQDLILETKQRVKTCFNHTIRQAGLINNLSCKSIINLKLYYIFCYISYKGFKHINHRIISNGIISHADVIKACQHCTQKIV